MYLNFDMVGSPNYGLFIYDGDGSGFGLDGPGRSDDIEALFERYYAERDIPSEPTAFSGRSDYQAFINNGIPAGGLFTGPRCSRPRRRSQVGRTAGVAYDPCYHPACDTIDNLSHRGAATSTPTRSRTLIYLYASGKEVIALELTIVTLAGPAYARGPAVVRPAVTGAAVDTFGGGSLAAF